MIDELRTASESFWHFLSDIAILPLLAAITCHLLKLCCTSRAWRNVLAAAYPDQVVRWPPILAAYVAGVGVNAIVPARAGDAVRIFQDLGCKRALAVHWGTFALTDEPLDEPPRALARALAEQGLGAQDFFTLPVGGTERIAPRAIQG